MPTLRRAVVLGQRERKTHGVVFALAAVGRTLQAVHDFIADYRSR